MRKVDVSHTPASQAVALKATACGVHPSPDMAFEGYWQAYSDDFDCGCGRCDMQEMKAAAKAAYLLGWWMGAEAPRG